MTSVSFEIYNSGEKSQISAYIDFVHTSIVDGPADTLPFCASYFTPSRGSVAYGETLKYTFSGSNPSLESSPVNFPLDDTVNAIAVTMDNAPGITDCTLYYALDGASKFTESDSYTLDMRSGTNTYFFPLGEYPEGTLLSKFKLTFNGKYNGSVTIYSISPTRAYFAPEYPGKLAAAVSEDSIVVSGSIPTVPQGAEKLCLYRLSPGEDERKLAEMNLAPYAETGAFAEFSFPVPLEDGFLYKYYAVYEGENVFVPVGAAVFADISSGVYAKPDGVKGAVGFTSAQAYEMYAQALTLQLSAEGLFAAEGEEYTFLNEKYHVNSDTISYLDKQLSTAYADGLYICVRLGAGEEIQALYAAVSYLAERYADGENGLISEFTLSGLDAGRLADEAGIYAAGVLRGAYQTLAAAGSDAGVSICGDSYAFFRTVLSAAGDFPYGIRIETEAAVNYTNSYSGQPISVTNADADCADALISYIKSVNSKIPVSLDFGLVDSCPRLAFDFIKFASRADCLYFRFGADNAEAAELFSLLDSADGLKTAEKYAADCGISDWKTAFPSYPSYAKTRRTAQAEYAAGVPDGAEIVFDASATDAAASLRSRAAAWWSLETVNGQSAACAAFELTESGVGHIRLTPAAYVSDGCAIYLLLNVDYLADGAEAPQASVRINGQRGTLSSRLTLTGDARAAVLYGGDATGGDIESIDIYVYGQKGDTPRLCVYEIAAAPYDEAGETDKAEETTAADTSSPSVGQTEEQTEAERQPGEGRLLLIVILVVLGMFILFGGVLAVLNKRQKRTGEGKK